MSKQFAQRFLDEWMKSQPHRENLAFADYDRTGVGAAVNGDTVYVAQLFASDLGDQADRDPGSGGHRISQRRGGQPRRPPAPPRRRCACAAPKAARRTENAGSRQRR